jgi:hypothetical protein
MWLASATVQERLRLPATASLTLVLPCHGWFASAPRDSVGQWRTREDGIVVKERIICGDFSAPFQAAAIHHGWDGLREAPARPMIRSEANTTLIPRA